MWSALLAGLFVIAVCSCDSTTPASPATTLPATTLPATTLPAASPTDSTDRSGESSTTESANSAQLDSGTAEKTRTSSSVFGATRAQNSVGSAAWPTVSGNKLIDAATGDVWIPRGFNYPSFGYACAQGWGVASASAEPDAAPATASAMASWYASAVRLPLNQDCWNATNGVDPKLAGDNYRSAVGAFVDDLNDAGLVVILDLHSRKTGPEESGQRAMPDPESATFFRSVATVFRDNPSIMFDAFNEPYSAWDGSGNQVFELTWACWADGGCAPPVEPDDQESTGKTYTAIGMKELVRAIRSGGATQPILVAGIDYANDLTDWLRYRPDDDQLVASVHAYSSQRCADPACWDQEIGPVAEKVPVVFGEFGATTGSAAGNAEYLNTLMNWADRAGAGYLAWAWWVLEDDTGPDAFALLSNDNGTPRAPVGTTLRAHLELLYE